VREIMAAENINQQLQTPKKMCELEAATEITELALKPRKKMCNNTIKR
jgi:hypothetical protein